MADLELTDEQAALLNRALAGEQVELTEEEAQLLNSAMGHPATTAPKGERELNWFDPKSISGTVLRGVGQGASYGFADELNGLFTDGVAGLSKGGLKLLQTPPGRAYVRSKMGAGANELPDAAIDALLEQAYGASLEQVTGVKSGPGQKTPYQQGRDAARTENAQSEADNPGTYLASNIAGSIATPGPKGGKMTIAGATLKPWVGRALVGGGVGIATGAGMSEGATPGEVARDARNGGAFGAVAAPVIGAVTDKMGSTVAKWLEERSRANALKAVGLAPGITDKARSLGIESADDLLALGAKARDEEGLIRPFGTPAGVAQRAEGLLDEATSAKSLAIDELERMAQEQGRQFDFNALAARADDTLRPPQGWDPLSRDSAKKAMELLGTASAAEGGFPMAEQVRNAAGKRIPWKAPAFGQALPEEVAQMRRAYGAIADEISKQAQDVEARSLLAQGIVPTPEDLGASNQVAAMNKRISTLLDLNTLANASSTREVAKSPLSLKALLGSIGVGGTMAASGNPVAGAATALTLAGANSLLNNRLPSALTFAQHGAAKALPVVSRAVETPLVRAGNGDRLSRAYKALMEKYGVE